MVLEYCHEKPVEYVVLLGFLAGCIELMMGLLKLGKYCFLNIICSKFLIHIITNSLSCNIEINNKFNSHYFSNLNDLLFQISE